MDKLQPLLTHKFWVMCGLALLLPLIGWFMGTGDLAAEIDARIETLDNKFDEVPQGDNANADWIDKIGKVNKVKEALLKQAGEDLLKQQVALRKWPANVEPDMESVLFRGEIEPGAREAYRTAYYTYLEDLLEIVEPFDVTTGKGKILMPRIGSIDAGAGISSASSFAPSSLEDSSDDDSSIGGRTTGIPHVPESAWRIYAPTSKVMWDAQEDVWLLRDLLESIRDVNGNANGIGEAAVRQVVGIAFQGGTRGGGESSVATEGEEADEDEEGNYMEEYRSGISGSNGIDGRMSVSVDFPLSEEVGSPAAISAVGEDDEEDEDSSSVSGSSGYPGYSGAALQALKRYVDEDPELPFKTRAFKMTVVMDHRKLPEFLDELTNSSWPVTILRVHQQQLFSDPSNRGGSSGGESDYGEESSGFGGSASSFRSSGFGQPSGSVGMQPGIAFGASSEDLDEEIGFGNGILGGIGQGVVARNYSHVANSAMQDRYLARVVIGGLMTLYQSPQEADGADTQADPPESPQSVEPAEQSAENAAPADPPQPADTEGGQPGSPSSDEAGPAAGTSDTDTDTDTSAEPTSTTPATDENTPGEAPASANETSSNPGKTGPETPEK